MATAGLGVLALVAGAAGGIAAFARDDARVVTAVGQPGPEVDRPAPELPDRPPSGQAGLGAGSTGHAQAEREADETRSAPGEADRRATRPPRRAAPTDHVPARTTGGAAATHHAAPAARPATAPPATASPSAGRPSGGWPSAGRPAAAVPAGPRVRIEQVSETEAIPFRTTLVRDPSLPPGSREVDEPGVPGERLLRYEVTYTGTQETSRRLLDSTVTREPQDRIVAVGHQGGNQQGGSQQGGGQQGGSGQHSGGDRGTPDRDDSAPRLCMLLGTCEEMDLSEESVIDDDLSLLDPSDIDELELDLPCPGEDEEEQKVKAAG